MNEFLMSIGYLPGCTRPHLPGVPAYCASWLRPGLEKRKRRNVR